MLLVVCQHQDHPSQTELHLLLLYAAAGTRSGQRHMSLDGRIEQLVENGLVIHMSVDVSQLGDGLGIAQETLITPSAL